MSDGVTAHADSPAIAPIAFVALTAIVVAGLMARVAHLRQPIRYDEAITWIEFASRPWHSLFSDYRYPNNQIFHTILVKCAVFAFGNEEWVLRLPAFLAGIAMVPLTWAVALRTGGARVALVAAAVVAGSGALILYSTNARGYTIIADCMLVLILIVQMGFISPWWRWGCFVLVAALGLWTIPIMLFPLGGIVGWVMLNEWRMSHRMSRLLAPALAAAASIGLAVLLYLPVIFRSGLASIVSNRFVSSDGATLPFGEEFTQGIASTWELLTLGEGMLVGLLCVVLGLVGVATLSRMSRAEIPVILPVLLWSLFVVLMAQRFPPARTWLFLLPLLALNIGVAVARLIGDRLGDRAFAVVAIAVAVIPAVLVTMNGAIATSRETGSFTDAREVVQRLAPELRTGDHIVSSLISSGPLRYWMDRMELDPAYILNEKGIERMVVVINRGEGESEEMMIKRLGVSRQYLDVQPLAHFPAADVLLAVIRSR